MQEERPGDDLDPGSRCTVLGDMIDAGSHPSWKFRSEASLDCVLEEGTVRVRQAWGEKGEAPLARSQGRGGGPGLYLRPGRGISVG